MNGTIIHPFKAARPPPGGCAGGAASAISSEVAQRVVAPAVEFPEPVGAVNGLIIAVQRRLVSIEPQGWIGRCLPVLGSIVTQAEGKSLAEKRDVARWARLCCHADCAECQKEIPKYERAAGRWKINPPRLRVAFAAVLSNTFAARWSSEENRLIGPPPTAEPRRFSRSCVRNLVLAASSLQQHRRLYHLGMARLQKPKGMPRQ